MGPQCAGFPALSPALLGFRGWGWVVTFADLLSAEALRLRAATDAQHLPARGLHGTPPTVLDYEIGASRHPRFEAGIVLLLFPPSRILRQQMARGEES